MSSWFLPMRCISRWSLWVWWPKLGGDGEIPSSSLAAMSATPPCGALLLWRGSNATDMILEGRRSKRTRKKQSQIELGKRIRGWTDIRSKRLTDWTRNGQVLDLWGFWRALVPLYGGEMLFRLPPVFGPLPCPRSIYFRQTPTHISEPTQAPIGSKFADRAWHL